ncbi:MAG: DUF1045 domain-containing protein [Methyloceanibacter sp.]
MLNCAHLEPEQKGAATSWPSYVRYAIYYTPQPGTALAAFGRSWFGRANDGATLEAFSDAGLSGFAKIPAIPGRYTGLHALFRPPFALREGVEPDEVRRRLIDFTANRKAVDTGPLTLARVGRYLVLRPVDPKPELDWLAAQCVGAFDGFAAEPGETEYEEHANPQLSAHQQLLLKSFGHPRVLSEYRFSIALTGPLDNAHLERVSQALWPVLEEICASGATIDGLSLFGDPGGRTPMRLIGRYRLAG